MGRQTGKNATPPPSVPINGTKLSTLRPARPTMRPATNASKGSSQQTGVDKGNGEPGKPNVDRSQLNFPYDVRLSGYSSIQNAVANGTARTRRLLMEECDYVMECRVCRNLFRSLPNFITHKLNYCKKTFDSTWSIGLSNLIQSSNIKYNIEYEVDPALLLDDNSSSESNTTRSFVEMYSEIAMKAGKCPSSTSGPSKTHSETSTASASSSGTVKLQLKPLVDTPGGSIVLQQREIVHPSNCDIQSSHFNPIQTAQRDTAILGPDGKVFCTGSSRGIEQIVSRLSAKMSEMESRRQAQETSTLSLSCDICKTVFDSDKALRQHKRESLDCGKTWGCKFPINQRVHSNPKLLSPTARRQSDKLLSPTKHKRTLSLSPAKKIKLKYTRLDYSGNTFGEAKEETKFFSCTKCSLSFNTDYEMSKHVIDCSKKLGGDRQTEDRISITKRDGYNFNCKDPVEGNMRREDKNPNPEVSPQNETHHPIPIPSPSSSKSPSPQRKPRSRRKQTLAPRPAEVNNNRQEKADESSQVTNPDQGAKNENEAPQQPQFDSEEPKVNGHEALDENLQIEVDSGFISDITGDCISVESSESSIDLKKPVLPTGSKSRKSKSPRKASTMENYVRLTRKPQLSTKDSRSGPGKAINLRRAVNSRLRKSGRSTGLGQKLNSGVKLVQSKSKTFRGR